MSPPWAISYLWKPSHSCLQRLWRLVNPSRWTLVSVPGGQGARVGGQSLGGLFVNRCHSILVQAKASGRGRKRVCSFIWSPTNLVWVKSCPSLDKLIACMDPWSMYQGWTCKWGLHYLVPGSYVFASSFDEICKVFSLEEKKCFLEWTRNGFLKGSMKN